MAWINAVPDECEVSRREQFEIDDLEVLFPECSAFYIVQYLLQLGLTLGDQALTHSEIKAWQENTGYELSSWEAQIIKRLSQSYLSMSFESKKKHSETPWIDAPYYMTLKWRKAMELKQKIREASQI